MKVFLLLGSVGLMAAAFAQAASFDCNSAQTKTENLICSDGRLSKLDDEMAKAYAATLAQSDVPALVQSSQKAWLKERDRCRNVECLGRAMRARIVLLTSQPSLSVLPTTEPGCIHPRIDWRNYEWMLITGNDMTICEEMLGYLKSRPSDTPPPLCPDERLPKNDNWKRPESRYLTDAEMQALIRNIPAKWRQKPNGPASFEALLKQATVMRVIRTDITGDGIAETLLAYSENDYRKTCRKATQCASEIEPVLRSLSLQYPFNSTVLLGSGSADSYDLLPMNEAGTEIDWTHPAVDRYSPGLPTALLERGELIYYRGRPYWLSSILWDQLNHDDFAHSRLRANDQNSDIFTLSAVISGPQPRMHFKDIQGVGHVIDPACRFGYFHRENLKLNPSGKRR